MVILRVGDYSQGVDLRHQNLGRNHIEIDVDKERVENLNVSFQLLPDFSLLHLNQRLFGTPGMPFAPHQCFLFNTLDITSKMQTISPGIWRIHLRLLPPLQV